MTMLWGCCTFHVTDKHFPEGQSTCEVHENKMRLSMLCFNSEDQSRLRTEDEASGDPSEV